MNKEKSLCPSCKSNNVIDEHFDMDGKKVTSFLCIRCGFTSNTEYTLGSKVLTEVLSSQQHSKLILDLHFYDDNTGLYWFPMTLLKDTGVIMPEGDPGDWHWSYIPIIPIEENEKDEYGNEFDKRFAIDKIERFDKFNFIDACKKLGVIDENLKVD